MNLNHANQQAVDGVQSVVNDDLDSLDNQLDRLKATLETLARRLDPVLLQRGIPLGETAKNAGAQPMPPAPMGSPINYSLRAKAKMASDMADAVNNLIGDLAV